MRRELAYLLALAAAIGALLVPLPAGDAQTSDMRAAAATPVPAAPGAVLSARAAPIPSATPAAVRVTAIGDSVMLAAANDLHAAIDNLTIDAVVGRQVPAGLQVLRQQYTAGSLGSIVVIHMGTNGAFAASQFDEMMEMLGGARRVIFVNVKGPLPWEASDNQMLAEAVRRYPSVTLVDWHGATQARPELFWDDGVHLRPEGARVYAALVAAAVNAP